MAKSYSKQLGEWVHQRPARKRDRNFAAFLALRDEIVEALAAGYFVKTIWANLHETKRTDLGYQMFLQYVNRHIRQAVSKAGEQNGLPGVAKPAAHEQLPPSRSLEPRKASDHHQTNGIPGFTFNSIPRKEDLI